MNTNYNLLPLLSKELREIITELNTKYKSNIGIYLREADIILEGLNEGFLPHLYLKIQKLDKFIEWHHDLIKREVDALITDEVRMIDIRREDFELSYLPKGKEPEWSGSRWGRQNRQSGKPTKIIKKLFDPKLFRERDYELFNNQLRSIVDTYRDFRIVTGSDITYWYNGDQHYLDQGSLGGSCMKHSCCQTFFEIYENHASMLILVKNDKLLGRAILWTIGGKTYMDRVYVCKDYLENVFIDYAKEQKWYIRMDQSAMDDDEEVTWYGPEDNYVTDEHHALTINLLGDYIRYPYMDSFRYLSPDYKYITTECIHDPIYLSSTDGIVERTYTDYCATCNISETYVEGGGLEILNYSDFDDCYYCNECCVYCEALSSYISNDDAIMVCVDNLEDTEIYHIEKHKNEVVMIDDVYYDTNNPCISYDKETDTYYIKDEETKD